MTDINEGMAKLWKLFEVPRPKDVEPRTVPIVFVPGIMGSRLKQRVSTAIVWDPDESLFMWQLYKNASPADRRLYLVGGGGFDPSFLEVEGDTSPGSPDRGWASVAVDLLYRSILNKLQGELWSRHLDLPSAALTAPVHAYGYNWTASNATSGLALARFIPELIKFYEGKGQTCPGVILVTHSMGGLVARYACTTGGVGDQVLGVVHGVQPVTGSPAAYRRMKEGWERSWPLPTERIFGPTGRDVTAVLANIPGGLELLPSADYVDNAENAKWLSLAPEPPLPTIDQKPPDGGFLVLPTQEPQLHGKSALTTSGDPLGDPIVLNDPLSSLTPPPGSALSKGAPRSLAPELPLPTPGVKSLLESSTLPTPKPPGPGVYNEVYKEQHAYWRAVDPSQLNPGSMTEEDVESEWKEYERRVDSAKEFHEDLGVRKHPHTSSFYGSGKAHKTSDRVGYSYPPQPLTANSTPWTTNDALLMKHQTTTDRDPILDPPEGAGDGTVPESSGKALGGKPIPGIKHDKAYKYTAAIRFTVKSIIDILKNALC